MTQIRASQPFLPASSVRVVGSLLAALAVITLTACGSTKPKPAPLESLRPSATVQTVWSQRLGRIDGPMSLSVRNGVVTTASTDGDILALDLNSGRERWRARTKDDLTAAVGSDGRYAAVVTTENELQAFDQGKLLWTERLPGRVTTAPLVAGERVFIQSVDRSVRAYDVVDGRWLWQYQRPGGDPLALSSSGVLTSFRDTLVVGQGARLVGLDPVQGSVRFDVNVGTPRGSNEVERLADLIGPVARSDNQVCARAFQLSVACVDLDRGRVRWSRPQAGSRPVGADAALVVGADSADRLTAWKADNGDSLWRVDRFTYRGLSAPAVLGRFVAVVDGEGYLHVLSADDGRTLARVELDSAAAAAPVVSDQLLLVVTRKGTLYALRVN
ncbi:MAG TPA: outer membrane protein assembly factor BamB [Aquabacterium sp.]|nr:outer membrane protein assembly factor BamB [Aquabacterium sp.]